MLGVIGLLSSIYICWQKKLPKYYSGVAGQVHATTRRLENTVVGPYTDVV